MAALVQTIAVIDKSGKAISSVSRCSLRRRSPKLLTNEQNRHLVNVFKEAKAAYQERKAEVTAGRQTGYHDSSKGQRNCTASGERHRSAPSSPTHERHHHSSRRPSPNRHRSSGSVRSGSTSPSSIYPASQNRHAHDIQSTTSPPPSPGVRRSQTADDGGSRDLIPRKPVLTRSMTSPAASSDIDMNLAYGDLPPSSPVSRSSGPDQQELKPLVGKVRRLLEEADCLHHSVNTTISALQKNPEAMAAVALTLAEISNLVKKMAPGALTAFRGSAPGIFALLASPQFLIAGGVAVGITVVAFGGYKIVKRIRASEKLEREGSMDEMLEIGGDVSRIETWRRGIAETSIQSDETSVDGEFITPQALAMSRLNLDDSGSHAKTKMSSSKAGSQHSHRSRSRSSASGSSNQSSKKSEKSRKEKKVKKPSPLRLMFQ